MTPGLINGRDQLKLSVFHVFWIGGCFWEQGASLRVVVARGSHCTIKKHCLSPSRYPLLALFTNARKGCREGDGTTILNGFTEISIICHLATTLVFILITIASSE